jgi:hypothetical protein
MSETPPRNKLVQHIEDLVRSNPANYEPRPETTPETILADLLSGDSHRIWSASWAVMRLYDRPALSMLAGQCDAIENATRDIELGGLLASNRDALEAALGKLRFAADGTACLCKYYGRFDRFDPDTEAENQQIEIIEDNKSEWYAVCRCTHCARTYKVMRHEYHWPWWSWQALD